MEMGASVVVAQGREAGGHGLRYHRVLRGRRLYGGVIVLRVGVW